MTWDMVMAAAVIDHYAAPINNHILKKRRFSENKHHVQQQHAVVSPKHLVGEALRQRIDGVDGDECMPGEEDTFFVADLGEVYRQYQRWKLNLPRVRPFYGEH
ncbi:hypothetical protein IMZ48_05485 [Candidatus Bathyarchaeota archaeon]|nr:hypothetical protein [Candidatus Bathyarchaeota archaeon]